MTIKLIGAFLVLAGCGGFGFAMAAAHRHQETVFRQYLIALELIECELACRLTPLPQLCSCAAKATEGAVHELFAALEQELDRQVLPDVPLCVHAALLRTTDFSEDFRAQFLEFGHTLGRFDLPGQLKGLENAQKRARQSLSLLEENRSSRLRSYQTLGLCTGAALAILFL